VATSTAGSNSVRGGFGQLEVATDGSAFFAGVLFGDQHIDRRNHSRVNRVPSVMPATMVMPIEFRRQRQRR